jgi:hypothetical protein
MTADMIQEKLLSMGWVLVQSTVEEYEVIYNKPKTKIELETNPDVGIYTVKYISAPFKDASKLYFRRLGAGYDWAFINGENQWSVTDDEIFNDEWPTEVLLWSFQLRDEMTKLEECLGLQPRSPKETIK